MLRGQVPVSYDIGAFVNVNVNVRPSFPHDDIVSAMTEQAIVPNNLWLFSMSFC